jgi:hypothetical protein
MTTYIIVCVILFGIDALCKSLVLAFGAGVEVKWTRFGLYFDTLLVTGMYVWGLVLLLK